MAAVKNPNAALDVIKLIVTGTVDFDAIGKILAYTHPAVFLEMVESLTIAAIVFLPWMRQAVDFLLTGNKIDAIKTTRSATGLGLKEAKDVCDHLSVKLGQWNQGYNPSPLTLQDSKDVFETLVAYCKHADITLQNSSL